MCGMKILGFSEKTCPARARLYEIDEGEVAQDSLGPAFLVHPGEGDRRERGRGRGTKREKKRKFKRWPTRATKGKHSRHCVAIGRTRGSVIIEDLLFSMICSLSLTPI